jgi:hypothetical protein
MIWCNKLVHSGRVVKSDVKETATLSPPFLGGRGALLAADEAV